MTDPMDDPNALGMLRQMGLRVYAEPGLNGGVLVLREYGIVLYDREVPASDVVSSVLDGWFEV